MTDLIKQHFRATNGLDAAGEKVINVAKADYDVLDDAVNVEFFIEQNTIQEYDSTRGYKANFAIIYDGRIWVSNREIASPAGAFQAAYWNSLRTDPKWEFINASGKQLLSGDFISADTTSSDLVFTLPSNPQDGDTICIRDVAGNTGYKAITVNASNQRMAWNKTQVTTMNITHPYSQVYYIFSNRIWQTFITDHEKVGKIVSNAAGTYQASASDEIYARFATSGPLNITLPKFMNNGDIILLKDLEGKEPANHIILSTFDSNSSINDIGTTKVELRTSGEASVIWDSADKLWRVWNGDIRQRLRIVRDDVTLVANESVMVFGANNSTVSTINVTLPIDIQNGDNVRIALNYMRKGQTVVIKAATGSTIATNKAMVQFPRRSEYPPADTWVQVQSLTINGTDDYPPIIELAYVDDTANSMKYWVAADISPRVERVDATNRDRLGVIALATQAQANVDKSASPEKELAITPETLANRTATETRQGIAAIATTAQVNQVSTATFDDLTFVTPKKLNERTATETRRGLAEIATQAETNQGTDDITIVTPKKLEARRATETMAGIAPIVTAGGNKPTARNQPGTGIYDYADGSNIVTPKGIREIKSSTIAQGTIFLATDTEVIEAPAYDAVYPLAVTPSSLHKKTATEGRIGFTQTATQAEVNAGTDDFKYVTPLKLATRKAIETLDGIIRIGTQTEFAAGTLDNVASTPLKIKAYFSGNRVTTNPVSGLTQTGNIWSGLAIDIQQASDTQRGTVRKATADEVDAGTNDDTFVTPKRLQLKKATETTEGSIRFATAAESATGTADMLAISPKNFKYVIQQEATWDASPTLRGPVKISSDSITFIGNSTSGNTQDLELYVKSGYAISPYELNRVLANYLPLKAVAADSSQLGGQLPTNYIRRDIAQTVDGALTLTKDLTLSAPLTSSSTGRFTAITADTSMTIDGGVLNINSVSNAWKVTAGLASGNIIFSSNSKNVLTLGNTGTVTALGTIITSEYLQSNKGFYTGNAWAVQPDTTAKTLAFGNVTNTTSFRTLDASTLAVTDPSGTYNVINKKNYIQELGADFIRKNANDTVGAVLTFTRPTLQAQAGTIDRTFIDNTPGNFSIEVTDQAVYKNLPGYAVPIRAVNADGTTANFIKDYSYTVAPGTLTQTATASGKYQIWAPRPVVTTRSNDAQTFWIRNFNTAKNAWEEFGRMYTTSQPVTTKEIGAASILDSSFNDLTIRDWIQVGNVRIRPDNDLKTVVFEWIE